MKSLLSSFPEIPLVTGKGFDFVNDGLNDDARIRAEVLRQAKENLPKAKLDPETELISGAIANTLVAELEGVSAEMQAVPIGQSMEVKVDRESEAA